MSTSAPLDRNDPTMLAWNAFRETEEYANAARWAISPQDTAGSLWCAFAAGFAALRAALAEEKRAHEADNRRCERAMCPGAATMATAGSEWHTRALAAERRAEEAERERDAIAARLAEAVGVLRDLTSEPDALDYPLMDVYREGPITNGEHPLWTEGGLYGRVGKEAARTLLARHGRARTLLASLAPETKP